MAEQMYSNPGGMAPQVDWKPKGFLAGSLYGQQEENYNTAIKQQQFLQNLTNLLQEAKVNDYMKDSPVRDAKRGLDISTYNAQAPIQGTLAGGRAAEAQGVMDTAPGQSQVTNFKNSQFKKAYAEEMVGNYLSSILEQHKNNPMQAMMIWRDQVVPQLEQRMGEPLPQQFKSMDINQMQMVSQSLTQSAGTRQAILQQAQKDRAHGQRTSAEIAGRERVASIRGDITTAGAQRQAWIQRQIEAEVALGANPNEAIRIVGNRVAGNPETRGAQARLTEAEERRLQDLQREKFNALPAPDDHSRRVQGQLYKLVKGQDAGKYGRWDGKGLVPVK